MQSFRRFVETHNIYGFKHQNEIEKEENDLPIQSFNINKMMNLVAKAKISGIKRPFVDVIQWGEGTGTVRIKLTPNIRVIIERKSSTLDGESTWITKKVFKIKSNEYAGKEHIVAEELISEIEDLLSSKIDVAGEFNDLFGLTKRVAIDIKNANKYFNFHTIKKVNENNYNIIFNISNYGVGRLGRIIDAGPSPTLVINLAYLPKKGVIKCIVNALDIEEESGSWNQSVPYFISDFTPTQSESEMSKIIFNSIRSI